MIAGLGLPITKKHNRIAIPATCTGKTINIGGQHSIEEDVNYSPVAVTDDGGVLLSYHVKRSGNESYESRARVAVYYSDKASFKDITPANLSDVLQPEDHRITLYDPARGIVMFFWDGDSGTMTVWCGRKTLEKVGSVSNVVSRAMLYQDDSYMLGALTRDGGITAYDFATGKLRLVDGYSTIAKTAAAEISLSSWRMIDCVFADGIAAYQVKDRALTLLLVDGREYICKLHDPIVVNPFIPQRTGVSAAFPHSEAKLKQIRLRASELPSDYISVSFKLVPLNESSIAVFDRHFQRLVIITPK